MDHKPRRSQGEDDVQTDQRQSKRNSSALQRSLSLDSEDDALFDSKKTIQSTNQRPAVASVRPSSSALSLGSNLGTTPSKTAAQARNPSFRSVGPEPAQRIAPSNVSLSDLNLPGKFIAHDASAAPVSRASPAMVQSRSDFSIASQAANPRIQTQPQRVASGQSLHSEHKQPSYTSFHSASHGAAAAGDEQEQGRASTKTTRASIIQPTGGRKHSILSDDDDETSDSAPESPAYGSQRDTGLSNPPSRSSMPLVTATLNAVLAEQRTEPRQPSQLQTQPSPQTRQPQQRGYPQPIASEQSQFAGTVPSIVEESSAYHQTSAPAQIGNQEDARTPSPPKETETGNALISEAEQHPHLYTRARTYAQRHISFETATRMEQQGPSQSAPSQTRGPPQQVFQRRESQPQRQQQQQQQPQQAHFDSQPLPASQPTSQPFHADAPIFSPDRSSRHESEDPNAQWRDQQEDTILPDTTLPLDVTQTVYSDDDVDESQIRQHIAGASNPNLPLAPPHVAEFLSRSAPATAHSLHNLYQRRISEAQCAMGQLSLLSHRLEAEETAWRALAEQAVRQRIQVEKEARVRMEQLHAALEREYDAVVTRLAADEGRVLQSVNARVNQLQHLQTSIKETRSSVKRRLKASSQSSLVRQFNEIVTAVNSVTQSALSATASVSVPQDPECPQIPHPHINERDLAELGLHCRELDRIRIRVRRSKKKLAEPQTNNENTNYLDPSPLVQTSLPTLHPMGPFALHPAPGLSLKTFIPPVSAASLPSSLPPRPAFSNVDNLMPSTHPAASRAPSKPAPSQPTMERPRAELPSGSSSHAREAAPRRYVSSATRDALESVIARARTEQAAANLHQQLSSAPATQF